MFIISSTRRNVLCIFLVALFSLFNVGLNAQDTRLWATYYGGTADEFGWNVHSDDSGNVYLSGQTNSDTGIASGGFQNTPGGSYDAFLIKFDPAGHRVWGTYYGGTGTDYGYGVTTDVFGNIYLAGHTTSDSAIASGGFQNTYAGAYDGFLVKFDSEGNRRWATYYGGSGDDFAYSVSTDATGNVYISGGTSSISGIDTLGFQGTFGGGAYDSFLAKFDSAGNRIWATYYGGPGTEHYTSVATDLSGMPYLSGYTSSTSGIASGGFQTTFGGGVYDAFLVRFNAEGERIWATYYGGPGDEEHRLRSIDTDTSGNVYLAGYTTSTTGIASGGFKDTISGYIDAYLVKFDRVGSRLWATYYGGTGYDGAYSVRTDALNNVFLAGYTNSTAGIAADGFQDTFGGGVYDAFLSKFDEGGSRICATYYGGTGDEYGYNIAVTASGSVYLTGQTNSPSGIASGGFQNIYGGGFYDAYLVNFTSAGTTSVTPSESIVSAEIFPNPSNGVFKLIITSETKYPQVEVFDILGEKIFAATIENQQVLIDISDQPKGLYILMIRTERGEKIARVLSKAN